MKLGVPPGLVSAIARLLIAVGCLCFLNELARGQDLAPYRDPKVPVEQRVSDLLSRMTLEEKVAQMEGAWENKNFHKEAQTMFVDEKGNFLPERAAVLMKDGLGQISRPSEGRGPHEMA